MNRNQFLKLLLLAVFALIFLASANFILAEDPSELITNLQDQIIQHRKKAEYREALALAKDLLDLERSTPSASTYDIEDSRRLVEIIESIVNLPMQMQMELAKADSLQDALDDYWYEANYELGADGAKQQLAIRRKILGDNHPWVAESLSEVGWHLRRQGLMLEAEYYFRGSLSIYRLITNGPHPDLAISISNLAGTLGKTGDFDEAESLFVESLKMSEEVLGGEHLDIATTLNNYASVLKDKGKYKAAEPLLRESLRIRRDKLGKTHWLVANALNNLGDLMASQGDGAGAEHLYKEAYDIYYAERPNHPNVGTVLNNLANVHHAKGNYAKAESLYQQALEIYTSSIGEQHWRYADCVSNLAILIDDTKDYVRAEPLHRRALEVYRSLYGSEHMTVAVSLSSIALNMYKQKNYEAAREYYIKSLEIKRKLLGNEHWSVAATLKLLGRLFIELNDFGESERCLTEAATIYDAARLRAGMGITRSTFRASPYKLLAITRLQLGNPDGAWSAAEHDHSRALADMLIAAESRSLNSEEIEREITLKKALGDFERKLAVYQKDTKTDSINRVSRKFEEARNNLLKAEAEWSSFQAEMARKYPVTEGQIYSLEQVRESLDDKTALIGWVDLNGEGKKLFSWVFAVLNEGPVNWARLNKEEQHKMTSEVRARLLRDALITPTSLPSAIRSHSHQLYMERIAPIADALTGIEKLVIIPSGAMLGIPVEVLITEDGTNVGDNYVVSYTPSATIYAWLKQKSRAKQIRDKALLIGDPAFKEEHLSSIKDAEIIDETEAFPAAANILAGNKEALSSLRRLPGTRSEIKAIASVVPHSLILLGSDASEQKLTELADSRKIFEFPIIHIATHALTDDEYPGRSALILSQVDLPDPLLAAKNGERLYDGLVKANEIIREWELDADLVTLSACETGLGKKVQGEGYVGFSHAFFQAGTRSLLVSLWKVDDRATALFMKCFYENLFRSGNTREGRQEQKLSKTEALLEAKQWLRHYEDASGKNPYQHPFYWSAFILIGDG